MNSAGKETGFTLIEVIVTLLIGSIMAVMIVSYMGSGLLNSVRSTNISREGNALNAVMEKINSDYRFLLLTHTNPLVQLRNNIINNDPSNSPPDVNYGKYECSFPTFNNANVTNSEVLMVTITSSNTEIPQSLTCIFSR